MRQQKSDGAVNEGGVGGWKCWGGQMRNVVNTQASSSTENAAPYRHARHLFCVKASVSFITTWLLCNSYTYTHTAKWRKRDNEEK